MNMLQILLLTMTLFTACRQSEPVGRKPLFDYNQEKIITNHSYGTDSLQRMDLYLPAGRSPQTTGTLLLIHGGGWNSGSKSDFVQYIDSFRRRMPDWAIVNMDYRLISPSRSWPAPEQDVKTVVDLLYDHSVEYGLRNDRMVLLGVSAGGHLALLQAYKHAQPRIAAVVDFFGPTDLTEMYFKPWHPFVPMALQLVTGTNPAMNPEGFRSWSPANFVGPQSPPTIMLHGSADPVVEVSQSKSLKKKLDAAGVKNELIVYPGLRHGWQGRDLSHSFDRIESFLRANVR